MMSRVRKGVQSTFGQRKKGAGNTKKKPEMAEYVKSRDYTGAAALLEFNRQAEEGKQEDTLNWLAYCYFHLGEYKKALDAYEEMLRNRAGGEEVHLYAACCMYFLQMYKQAESEAEKCTSDDDTLARLRNRLLFHIAHKHNEENKLMTYHQKLTDTKEDQLSLAAIHYLRSHFQEATDIYKRLLLENRDDLALNLYVAMCYYKLDYYDVSLEILAVYVALRTWVRFFSGRRRRLTLRADSSAALGASLHVPGTVRTVPQQQSRWRGLSHC